MDEDATLLCDPGCIVDLADWDSCVVSTCPPAVLWGGSLMKLVTPPGGGFGGLEEQ